ncbi:MAG: ABC transporter ATP-binding protein [Clostridia bacterium]
MDKIKNITKKEGVAGLLKSPYIRGFIKKYFINYLIGILFLVLIDFLQTRIPVIIGRIFDGLKLNTMLGSEITTNLIWIGILAVIIVSGRVAWRFFIFGTARKIERDIRNDLFAHLEELSLNYYHQHKTGEIMAFITNDLEAVRQAMGQGIMMVFDIFFLLVFILAQMVSTISWQLTVASVIPLIIIAIITRLLGPVLFKKYVARQEAFAKISDFVQEDMSGIKVIKAFVQQDKEIEAFKEVNKSYFKNNINLFKTQALMDPLMNVISGLSFAIAIGYGGYLAVNSTISLGDYTVFIQFLGMLVWPMMAVGMSINMITLGSASLKRIESILYAKPEIVDSPNATAPEQFVGSIEVKNLTYSYPENDTVVLKNISFEVKAGQTLGIVGRTGCGKTTLMNLMVRLYEPSSNTIFISGKDILDMPLKVLRGNIGYVPQDNFLFSNTIKNNVDFVDGQKTMEEVIGATEFSCVHDNIVEFTQGYETIVGERGVTLSGGQKQRISISRAYINSPEILILDDSVSAVDTDTEEKILENIAKFRKNKTNIIIAHRLSALQNADNIIVIDQGEIVEQGTHKQLIKNKGLYYSLHKKQQLEKMIDEQE